MKKSPGRENARKTGKVREISVNYPVNIAIKSLQIQLSDEQVKMIKGVTQELSLLRDQKEKLEQLQKLQDAFEADRQTGAATDKVKAGLDLMLSC